jgi:hypothetical protein
MERRGEGRDVRSEAGILIHQPFPFGATIATALLKFFSKFQSSFFE